MRRLFLTKTRRARSSRWDAEEGEDGEDAARASREYRRTGERPTQLQTQIDMMRALSSTARDGVERAIEEARERAATERRLHAVILAEERAARDGIVRGIRDERRMRELGVEGMDAEKLRGLRERGATHTSAGAVLDRRYIMGLVDETADLISLGSARRTGSSESPPKMSHAHAHDGREETQDSMSRTSMGSTLAAVSVVSVSGERYAEGMANALGGKADG